MHRLNKAVRPRSAGVILAGAALALVGCASVPTGERPRDDATSNVEVAETPTVETRERSRAEMPLIAADEGGFTITEQIRISGEARDAYALAVQSLEQGRYEQGIAELLQVIELAPNVVAPQIDLGMAYVETGDLEAAEAALSEALELAPDHPIANNELGIVYRKTGRFQEARASYERALAIQPAFHHARLNLGILCDLYLADLQCALENYEAYLESVVEDDEVSIWVADIRGRLNM